MVGQQYDQRHSDYQAEIMAIARRLNIPKPAPAAAISASHSVALPHRVRRINHHGHTHHCRDVPLVAVTHRPANMPVSVSKAVTRMITTTARRSYKHGSSTVPQHHRTGEYDVRSRDYSNRDRFVDRAAHEMRNGTRFSDFFIRRVETQSPSLSRRTQTSC